jgi:hypothetical protein
MVRPLVDRVGSVVSKMPVVVNPASDRGKILIFTGGRTSIGWARWMKEVRWPRKKLCR